MLVKSPSKQSQTEPNRRKKSPEKKQNGQTKSNRKATEKNRLFSLSQFQPWKVILVIIVCGLLGMLYLKHVFATQELLTEVKQLEQQYEQIKRKNDYYQLNYDRMIGPKEIYDKAKAAGFIDGGPAEKVIEVEPIE